MSDTQPRPDRGTDADLRRQVEALVAGCIEAMERGEADPLPRVCAGRPDLLPRVQRRLGQLAARGLIPGTVCAQPDIGPYRVVRELGSGGMGAVFLAQQSAPVQRLVAVKVIKLGMDTREVIARFHAERQVLARMSHPNIAQVFDAGSTGDGRPYFVMEYVPGQPLASFCNSRQLGVDERLRVFATICRAVQHAHDRGVIHRDLKPGNMLVLEQDGQVVPKVIDFGIAKAASPDLLAPSATRVDQVLGTPEYMSPEQARSGGLDVDTRTDVWSLGVVLYELLCGELPFDSLRLRRAGRHELERILSEELPTSPSTRLLSVGPAAAERLGAEGTSLRRRVRGELDWIALKALAKEPEARYPSALALAEDLERHLRHEPVQAVPPGAAYRLRKFVRRHRVPVAAAAAVFVALVVGLLVSVQATAAARAAQQQEALALDDVRAFYGLARDAVANLVKTADERLAAVPQADAARRSMLADALRFYDGLQSHQPADPSLQFDIAAAKDKAGVLQRRLGAPVDAIATLQDCIARAEALHRRHPEETLALRLQVAARGHLAEALVATGRSAESRGCVEAALTDLATLRGNGAGDGLDLLEAGLLANLGIESMDDPPRAIDCFDRSLVAWQRALDRTPGDAALLAEAARCLALRGEACTRQNRLDEAATSLDQAVAKLHAVPDPAPDAVREQLAIAQWARADLLRRLERMDEAVAAATAAVALSRQLAAEHPGVPGHADRQADGLQFLAEAALGRGELPAAVQAYAELVPLRKALADANPQSYQLRMRQVRAMIGHASAMKDLARRDGGSLAPALAVMEQAVAICDPLQASEPHDTAVVLTFAAAHEGRAALGDAAQQPRAALADHTAAQQALQALAAAEPKLAEVRAQLAMVSSNLALVHLQAGDFAAAVAAGETALEQARAGLGLDARHRQLREVLPQIAARLSAARNRAGDLEGSFAALLALFDIEAAGDEARAMGAICLGEDALALDAGDLRDRMLARAAVELRRSLAARAGAAHPSPRDLDLRLMLGSVLAETDADQEEPVLAEAIALLPALGAVSPDRVRHLFCLAAELALVHRDAQAAAAHVATMRQKLGPGGGCNYVCAVLLAQCAGISTDPERETFGARAVALLQTALERKEVPRDALQNDSLAALRGRADFQALLAAK